MKTYLIRRPYCIPSHIIAIAKDKKTAINMTVKAFGYAADTKASIHSKEGIILYVTKL